MKVLFIGGTGIISSACAESAIERGFELYLFNRGVTERPAPAEAHIINGDIRDRTAAHQLGEHRFDVVVDWVAYHPEHIENDLELFQGKVGQYIFISSASAYQKPPGNLPVTESTPLHNPFWEYSRAKISCEERLLRAYREADFPVTIVRPSHTYDCSMVPVPGRYTVLNRMLNGRPVIVHGDGTSIWVLTHHRDFAKGFIGLVGLSKAIGEAFHITSDELLTWNQIMATLGQAAGVEPSLVHVPSDLINAYDPEWGAGLLGDKAHSVIFDNSKIKRFVPDYVATIPFVRGAEEIIAWFAADPQRQVVDAGLDQCMDRILDAYQQAWHSQN